MKERLCEDCGQLLDEHDGRNGKCGVIIEIRNGFYECICREFVSEVNRGGGNDRK